MPLLLDFVREDGVLLKQDREKEEADEQVGVCSSFVAEEDEILETFLPFPAVKRELRNVARRPPGDIGCLPFLRSL